MSADAATMTAESDHDNQPKPAGKVRLLSLDDLDRRTRAHRHVVELRDAVVADLGGPEALSTLEALAAEHVALSAAMLRDMAARFLRGEAIDPTAIATITNTFNRSAAALGWRRRPRDLTPTLSEYLKAKTVDGGQS